MSAMATTIWKGHITFGLVSIPVKLYRAARAEKVSFRQLHASTGARIRQALIAEPGSQFDPQQLDQTEEQASAGSSDREPFVARASGSAGRSKARPFFPSPEPEPKRHTPEISRSEVVKGYEFAPDQY